MLSPKDKASNLPAFRGGLEQKPLISKHLSPEESDTSHYFYLMGRVTSNKVAFECKSGILMFKRTADLSSGVQKLGYIFPWN